MLSVFLHQGAADPPSEGWQAVAGSAGGATGTAVIDALGAAWRVQEPAGTSNAFLEYQQVPTSTQISEADTRGWRLSTRIRVPVAGQSAGTITSQFRDGLKNWQMEFGSNTAGDAVLTLVTPATQQPFSYTLTGAGETYNTYELVYTPAAQSAELFVNGIRITSYLGSPGQSTAVVQWGAQQSTSAGTGDFNTVEFTPFSVVWTGSANDNNWADPLNWSTDQVPGPNDDVLIDLPVQPGVPNPTIQIPTGTQSVNSVFCANNLQINGGTLLVAAPSRVDGTFTLLSGTLGGAGNLSVAGTLNWFGGTMGGSGKTIVAAGSSGTLLGNLALAREFDNLGTLQFQQGNLVTDPAGGAFLFNNLAGGQLTLTGVQTIGGSAAASPFLNGGTLNVAGPGSTVFSGPFTNTGSLNVNAGALFLNGASTTIGGRVSLASSAQFVPASGTLFDNVTLQGNFNFSNASFTAEHGYTILPASSVALSFTTLTFMGNQTLGGQGMLSLGDSSSLLVVAPLAAGGSATLTIGGGITVQGQGAIGGGTGTAVLNDGILIGLLKPFAVSVPNFTNNGTVQGLNGGTVGFTGGVFVNGGGGIADINGNLAANALTITGGTFAYDGPSGTSVNNFTLSGQGTLGGSGNLTITSTIDWGDGTAITGTGKLTLAPAAAGTLTGNLTLDRELDNGGTLNVAALELGLGSHAMFNNLTGGQVNASGNDTIGGAAGTSTVAPFNNGGTLTVSGTGNTTLNAPFTSTGTINVNAGTLFLNGANTVGGRVSLAAGAQFLPASGTLFNNVTLLGNFTFSNASFSAENGFTIMPASSVSLSFTKLSFIGDQTLGGQGTLSLGDASSIIAITPPAAGGSGTLTLGGGIALQGQGAITGGATTTLVDNGTLTVLGNLDVSVPNFTSTGTTSVVPGGVLQVQGNAALGGGITVSGGASLGLGGGIANSAPSQIVLMAGGSISGGGIVQFQGNGNSQILGSLSVGATLVNGTAAVALLNSAFTGTLGVDGGTLTLKAGTLTLGGTGTSAALPASGASAAAAMSPLTLTNGGRVDLATNRLLVNYAAGNDPVATIRSYLSSGSLFSSFADGSHALGLGDGADGIVPGLPPGQLLVRYTVRGDANLDGAVGILDLLALAHNYGRTNANGDQGDFNGDEIVNFVDLMILARDYGKSVAAAVPSTAAALTPAGAAPSLSAPRHSTRVARSARHRVSHRRHALRE